MDARGRIVTGAWRALIVLICAVVVAACSPGGGDDGADGGDRSPGGGGGESRDTTAEPPAYQPPAGDVYPNAKRLAGRIAQRVTTYDRGAHAREVARSLPQSGGRVASLAEVIEPVVHRSERSTGEVVYGQLSGITPSTAGVMVAVRQTLEDDEGETRTESRVFDVRLRRAGGPWELDTIGSVGGRPIERTGDLPSAAERVLDNPRIELFDSARWDILSGDIDPALLEALEDAARRYRLSVLVLRAGHPPNVWATNRPSAHTQGFAADIYAIDGELVVRQRSNGSAAYRLAQSLLAAGARQLGSPWVLGTGPPQSFTDDVHQDHLHLQQTAAQ
jgi:hypothetical protein